MRGFRLRFGEPVRRLGFRLEITEEPDDLRPAGISDLRVKDRPSMLVKGRVIRSLVAAMSMADLRNFGVITEKFPRFFALIPFEKWLERSSGILWKKRLQKSHLSSTSAWRSRLAHDMLERMDTTTYSWLGDKKIKAIHKDGITLSPVESVQRYLKAWWLH